MKWLYCSKLSIAIGLSCISFSSLSNTSHNNNHADFYVQIGSYSKQSNALRAKSQRDQSKYPVLIQQKNGYHVLLIGPFKSISEARLASLKSGVSPYVVRINTTAPAQQQQNITPVYKDKDGVTPENRWFVGLGGGWMIPSGTHATNFASSGMPGFPDDRYLNTDSDNTGQISGFAGYQWRRPDVFIPAISLSFEYTYTFPVNIQGVIFVNNLPDTQNFTYQYDISQQIFMPKLKVDLYQWQQWMPYISGGLGVVLNRVSNYSDSPIPGATVMDRNYGFNTATKTQFAASAGVGLDYWLNSNSQISAGYEFSYYGKARTGNGQGSLSENRLENNLDSNTFVIKGTYFID